MIAFADEQEGVRILNLISMEIRTVVGEFNGYKFRAINSLAFGKDDKVVYFS